MSRGMKGWKYLAWITCTVGALAAAPGCAGEDRNAAALAAASTSEVEQHADQCGAQRYRGSDTIACSYKGQVNSNGALVSATCLNFNQISCKYNLTCDFRVSSISTNCVSDMSSECWSVAPPEASDPVPQDTVVNELPPGSFLCEPPPGQQPVQRDLNNFCNTYHRASAAYDAARTFCEGSSSYNSGGAVTCCLNCPSPLPPTGGPPACYMRDAGVGADAGPPADARTDAPVNPFDAGHYLDAITEIRR
jgi:hypothetical protein